MSLTILILHTFGTGAGPYQLTRKRVRPEENVILVGGNRDILNHI